MALAEIANQGMKLLSSEALMNLLREASKKNVKLSPTNAATQSIIQNTCAAGIAGAGVGIVLSLLRVIPGPIGLAALGAGLVSAGIGFTATKYNITISERQDGQFVVTIEG